MRHFGTKLLLGLVLSLAVGAFGADMIHVDFTVSLTNDHSWCYNNSVRIVDSGRAASLGNKTEITSPLFGGANITNITLHAKLGKPSYTPRIILTPVSRFGDALESHIVTDGDGVIISNHVWSAEERVASFRIFAEPVGNGRLYLYGADIYFASAGPSELSANAFRDAVVVRWRNNDDAISTTLRVVEREVLPERYETLAEWDFSGITCSAGNTQAVEDGFFDSYPGLSGENINYPGSSFNGNIQVGKSSVYSFLRIDSIPDGSEELWVTASIRSGQNVKKVAVEAGVGGVVRKIDELSLGVAEKTYIVDLKDVPGQAALYLRRDAKDMFLVKNLKLIRDYHPIEIVTIRELAGKTLPAGSDDKCKAVLRIKDSGIYVVEAWSTLFDGTLTPNTEAEFEISSVLPRLFPRGTIITIR